MPITQATFDNLTRALTDLKLPSLSFAQAELLVSEVTVPTLQNLIAGARVNEAADIQALDQWVTAVRAHYTLLELGLRDSSLTGAAAMIRAQGLAKVRLTVGDAMKGDQSAKTILSGWLNASPQASPDLAEMAAPVAATPSTQRPPIHPTPVPPPAARTLPVERAAPSSSAQSPRSVQPRPERAAPSAETASNVRHLRPDDQEPTRRPSADDRPDREAAAPQRDGQSAARRYDQVEAYGGDVAIQFERCATKDRSTNTINLKCARAKPGGKTRNGCDWRNAILMMLTPHEVQLVTAVLMGYLPKFRAAGHGALNDKWFELEETSDSFAGAIRFTVAQGKDDARDIRKVSVGSTDSGEVLAIFLRAAQDQLRLTGPLLLAAIRRTADLYAKGQAAKQGRQDTRRVG